jgi:hypothetical protein
MKARFAMMPLDFLLKFAKQQPRPLGEKGSVLAAIMYKTWGFSKTKDWIALSQLENITGMSKPNIIRAMKKLTADLVIKVEKDSKGHTIIHLDNDLIPIREKSLSKQTPTIENSTKEESYNMEDGELRKRWKWLRENGIEHPPRYLEALRKKCGQHGTKAINKAWNDLNHAVNPSSNFFYARALLHADELEKRNIESAGHSQKIAQ